MNQPLNHFERQGIIWKSSLPANEKLLALALNSFVDGNGECFPGQKTLADMCGMSDRTVRGLCKKLETKGVLVRSHRYAKDGNRTSDLYRIDFQALPEKSAGSAKTPAQQLPEKSAGSSLPENSAGRLPENSAPLPEESAGRLPENSSRDLSRSRSIQKNYPDQEGERVSTYVHPAMKMEQRFRTQQPKGCRWQGPDRPWILEGGKNFSPNYELDFLEYLQKVALRRIPSWREKAPTMGEVKAWLGCANHDTPNADERLSKVWPLWEEYQARPAAAPAAASPQAAIAPPPPQNSEFKTLAEMNEEERKAAMKSFRKGAA